MKVLGKKEFVESLQARAGALYDSELVSTVTALIDDVRKRGDCALIEYTRRFDGVDYGRRRGGAQFEVQPGEIEAAYEGVDAAALEAIRFAVDRVREYSRNTMTSNTRPAQVGPGVLGRVYRAVDSAGLYIPGGRKPYISTAIMTAVPARVAGVRTVVACTPPRPDGGVDPHILVACGEAGVDRIFKVGGAQAIAAMAYGSETVPRVDKIVGPGNRYVTAAKRLVYGDTGIDSLAGPSEVAILADETANLDWVAADLFAQVEHGADSRAALLSTSAGVIGEVGRRLMLAGAEEEDPRVVGVLCDSLAEALELVNRMAPEHLQVMTVDPIEVLPLVRSAGAILIGGYSPAALGDYAAGPSHVLPTGGAARFSSGLTADDFMVSSSLVWGSRTGMRAPAEAAAVLADLEGFVMHARALRARLGDGAGPEAAESTFPGGGVGMR